MLWIFKGPQLKLCDTLIIFSVSEVLKLLCTSHKWKGSKNGSGKIKNNVFPDYNLAC